MRTSRYRNSLLVGLCAVMAIGVMTPLGVKGARTDVATLKRIASHVDARTGIVTIEASDPVPYVALQPDSRTFIVELRDVAIAGVTDDFRADPRHPISAVRVQTAQAFDGVNVARISMKLTYDARPRVRSSRHLIHVETDRIDSPEPKAGAVPVQKAVISGQRPSLGAPPTAAQSRAALQTPAAAAQAPAQLRPAPAKYTGHPVSLDFQGADLRAVLRAFAEISGLNIVIDSTIQGTVDVALRDVPWDQAFDIILRANRLGYIVDGTIVRVAPLTVLADEETQRRKLLEEQALAGELRVLTRPLSYAKAEDLRALLTSTALSQRGSIQIDARTNTIIINDLPERLERAAGLISTLDVPQPQVEIEARIVQTNRNFASRLGLQWGVSGRAAATLGNTLPMSFPNQASVTGRTGVIQSAPNSPEESAATAVNLGVVGASSAVGLSLGSINGAVNLDLALSALETSGQGRILSTPRVATQNNVEAEITQGIQIPIQTVANNTVTVSFRDAALTLRVTPQITASNTVIMRISVANEAPDFSRSINNIPPIDTQRAVTQVLVSDGETTVIGGIYISREQSTQDRTPALYRIPLLGWLFRRTLTEDESRELLIFITPKIVKL